jgi:Flp pilus assembly protein TadG
VARIHRQQNGTISILSVFTVLLLTIVLGMVMNVGRHVDGKLRLQNAADDVAYSGGVVLARGLNTLTFTNHMLCEVFSMTAFLREAKNHNSLSYVSLNSTPSILAAWQKAGAALSQSGVPALATQGQAIQQEVPLEQQMVTTFCTWADETQKLQLPLMEEILRDELIPKYQQAVVQAFPDIAQNAANAVAQQNGEPNFGRGTMQGALWRTSGQLVGSGGDGLDLARLAADPNPGGSTDPQVAETARAQRKSLAHLYLNQWNRECLAAFDRYAQMSQFGPLWRGFTCGYLEQLLNDEYPDTNLPQVIARTFAEGESDNSYMEQNFMLVGVAYWPKLHEMMPGLFKDPLQCDDVAYAQVRIYVPRQRLVWQYISPGGGAGSTPLGGMPGDPASLPPDPQPPGGGNNGPGYWQVGRQNVPIQWDLTNQSWTCQLVPATGPNLTAILQTPPPGLSGITLPNLGGLNTEDIKQISSH